MVLIPKVLFNHFWKRQFVVLHYHMVMLCFLYLVLFLKKIAYYQRMNFCVCVCHHLYKNNKRFSTKDIRCTCDASHTCGSFSYAPLLLGCCLISVFFILKQWTDNVNFEEEGRIALAFISELYFALKKLYIVLYLICCSIRGVFFS